MLCLRFTCIGCVDEFCDPEIKQFWLTIGIDENIRRLQIAVDNKLFVGERNCRANLSEKSEYFVLTQTVVGPPSSSLAMNG